MGRLRKRVEAEAEVEVEVEAEDSAPTGGLKRAKDGSAFTKCTECKKDVPVALISFHNCSLDAKIKMNLDALVVEAPADAKKKPSERKKPKLGEPKAKKEKKEKDPNAPKRPQTAFFVFLETFRKEFTEANPDSKKGSTVAKEAGVKWKSMTEEEKKPYFERAAERKVEYGKGAVSTEDAVVDDEEKLDETEKEAAEAVEAEEPHKEEKESTEVDEVSKPDLSKEESTEVIEDDKPDKEEKESIEVDE